MLRNKKNRLQNISNYSRNKGKSLKKSRTSYEEIEKEQVKFINTWQSNQVSIGVLDELVRRFRGEI